jgi:large subunit ribosomal protein L15e
MGLYKHIRELWKSPSKTLKELNKARLLIWRRELRTTRIERPTRLDRARSLGYKAKQGVIVVRQRVLRGGRQKPQFKAGRRPKRYGRKKILNRNYQSVAEERASRVYKNCEVLGSYEVGKDGKYYWYEIIFADRNSPTVLSNKSLKQKVSRKAKAYRGLTSAGRKGRGLRNKGKGAEKVR